MPKWDFEGLLLIFSKYSLIWYFLRWQFDNDAKNKFHSLTHFLPMFFAKPPENFKKYVEFLKFEKYSGKRKWREVS